MKRKFQYGNLLISSQKQNTELRKFMAPQHTNLLAQLLFGQRYVNVFNEEKEESGRKEIAALLAAGRPGLMETLPQLRLPQ